MVSGYPQIFAEICVTRQSSGPGCKKQLNFKWDFVQLFSVSQRIFFFTGIVLALLFYPSSADLSTIVCKENFQSAGNS